MLTGPQRKFCEGIVAGKTATDAYGEAYPKASPAARRAHGARLVAKGNIQAEIERLRARAAEKAGGAVLTLAEKRSFLARLLRADLMNGEPDGDLYVSVEYGEKATKFRLGDKLKALELDNDLAGEGSEAGANDALAGLLERVKG